jgi:hypothetical protein
MPIRFACPTCGTALAVSSKQAGQVMSCTSCKQLVQVPQPPPRTHKSSRRSGGGKGPVMVRSPRREGMGAFWALCRLSLWGVCFAGILLGLGYYLSEIGSKERTDEKMVLSLQTLVWLFGAYYIARTFDDSTKSLHELIARMRRRKTQR